MGPEITLDVLTTRPSNSIIHQSYHSRLRTEPLNGDGFGIAWYVPDVSPEPAKFRSIQPAWNNLNLLQLARVCRSSTVLAHVRAATRGTDVSEANCHPFTAGRLAFMHNGSVVDFPKLRRRIFERLSDESCSLVQGNTDSELLFALFCDHFTRQQGDDGTEAMAHAMIATIGEVARLTGGADEVCGSFLNMAVTDGACAIVSRYATGGSENLSLYTCAGARFVCENGVCSMIRCNGRPSSIIVASEPLNDEPEWKPVPPNHLVVVDSDHSLGLRAVC
ncbi:MAG TPA: class II glutamine amidotransferase [Phycisphaerae bacterium]|nr:class II glutamine amidotransferase [Phycisphaerae bacterium]